VIQILSSFVLYTTLAVLLDSFTCLKDFINCTPTSHNTAYKGQWQLSQHRVSRNRNHVIGVLNGAVARISCIISFLNVCMSMRSGNNSVFIKWAVYICVYLFYMLRVMCLVTVCHVTFWNVVKISVTTTLCHQAAL